MLFVAIEFFIYSLPTLEIRYFFLLLFFHESVFFHFLSTFIAHEQFLYPNFLPFFQQINAMERKTILFYYNLYTIPFLLFFFGWILFFTHRLLSNGFAHASFLLDISFKVFFQKQQHKLFIAYNLFKEFLINDEMGNETEVKCRIFCLKRDSRHSVVNHSHRRLPFAVVIESTPNPKSADLIVLLYNNNWHAL